VLWGCAKLDFKPGAELLERLPARHAGPAVSEFKPQVGGAVMTLDQVDDHSLKACC